MLTMFAYRVSPKFEKTSLRAYTMNRFTKADFKTRLFSSVNYSMVFFVLVIAFFIIAVSRFSGNRVANQKEILTDAINRDVVHCYSIEGFYPPSLEYIEEHYGLTYDSELFIVDYEPIASNLMPNITIIERNRE